MYALEVENLKKTYANGVEALELIDGLRGLDLQVRRLVINMVRSELVGESVVELVDGELAELGLEGALRRQTSVGLPLHDLRRLLAERWRVEGRRVVFQRSA